ncbi:basic salivary proline-rich protein 4 isoform X3 [Tachyglossus aculeatus]|uniref:basic salivary proline-rich protein 4 isoform X3 n=1 Tax=Tachyglossus aculeatus TaxID=9261 RepID=UPI0018F37E26|nr:basic salivary proline-rich protein 4 isoform X3 [Tachyglossus aculeatus]
MGGALRKIGWWAWGRGRSPVVAALAPAGRVRRKRPWWAVDRLGDTRIRLKRHRPPPAPAAAVQPEDLDAFYRLLGRRGQAGTRPGLAPAPAPPGEEARRRGSRRAAVPRPGPRVPGVRQVPAVHGGGLLQPRWAPRRFLHPDTLLPGPSGRPGPRPGLPAAEIQAQDPSHWAWARDRTLLQEARGIGERKRVRRKGSKHRGAQPPTRVATPRPQTGPRAAREKTGWDPPPSPRGHRAPWEPGRVIPSPPQARRLRHPPLRTSSHLSPSAIRQSGDVHHSGGGVHPSRAGPCRLRPRPSAQGKEETGSPPAGPGSGPEREAARRHRWASGGEAGAGSPTRFKPRRPPSRSRGGPRRIVN